MKSFYTDLWNLSAETLIQGQVQLISSNLVQIHAAKGVNNHMGSKFTADTEKTEEALEVIKQFLSLYSRLCAQIEFVPVSRLVIDAK